MSQPTKTPVSLTDSQVIDKAWKIIGHADVKSNLPPRYTLRQLHEASNQLLQLGVEFFRRYGDRLEKLDSVAYRELKSWEELL